MTPEQKLILSTLDAAYAAISQIDKTGASLPGLTDSYLDAWKRGRIEANVQHAQQSVAQLLSSLRITADWQ